MSDIPTLNPEQLADHVRICASSRETLLIAGPPGCGKTAVVKEGVLSLGFDLQIIHLCVSDPIDAKGMPCFQDNEISGQKEAEFLPFGDMRKMIECDKDTVVFLDDFGTAAISVQTGYMQVVQERRLNDFPISEKIAFIIATNRSQDKSGANQGVIETIKGRASIVATRADVDVWCNYVQKNGVADYSDQPMDACPPALLAFARFVNSKKEPLFDFSASKNVEEQTCTPRNMSRMGRMINRYAELDRHLESGGIPLAVIHGCIGGVQGTRLAGFAKTISKLPSLKEILASPTACPVPSEPNQLYALNGFLIGKADMVNFAEMAKYITRWSPEFRALFVSDMTSMRTDLKMNDGWDILCESTNDTILGGTDE